MNRMRLIFCFLGVFILLSGTIFAVGQKEGKSDGPKPGEKVRIAMVVKNLGNSFFEACRDGGMEAAEELGNIELIYQGPSTPTAEGQIEIINSLIAQQVDAIVISANDVDALVPTCKKALSQGIVVISFDSGIAAEGRILQLDPSSSEFIGRSQVKTIADMIQHKGQIAVLSASSQATNQNTWIEWMKKELEEPAYNQMELVDVVYGDDLSDKSYREAMGLFKSYPDLRGIISPTTVGIAATGKALEDAGLSGKIELTGLGLPSEMKQYIKNGTCKKMALWNPIDLGYSATYIAFKLMMKDFKGEVGEVMNVGRMGNIKIGNNNIAVMSEPYVFEKNNIDKFATIY